MLPSLPAAALADNGTGMPTRSSASRMMRFASGFHADRMNCGALAVSRTQPSPSNTPRSHDAIKSSCCSRMRAFSVRSASQSKRWLI